MQRINHKASNPIQELKAYMDISTFFNRTYIVKTDRPGSKDWLEELWEAISKKVKKS